MLVPFTESLPLVIAVPETTVEYGGEFLIPLILLLLGKGAVEHGSYRLFIAFYDGIYVFRTAGTALNLEDAHTGIHHAVDEADGLQVLRTHYILVVYFKLVAGFIVCNSIAAAADLHTLATVGRAVGISETHVALARYSHAQSTMTEHFDTNLLAHRTADVLLLYLLVDVLHLVHVQFTCQYGNICKACIKLQSLCV